MKEEKEEKEFITLDPPSLDDVRNLAWGRRVREEREPPGRSVPKPVSEHTGTARPGSLAAGRENVTSARSQCVRSGL